MPYVTAPQAKTTAQTYRYYVELASNERDWEGVPESTRMIDVVVLEPTRAAIETLLQVAGYLDGYRIMTWWVPEDCDCF